MAKKSKKTKKTTTPPADSPEMMAKTHPMTLGVVETHLPESILSNGQYRKYKATVNAGKTYPTMEHFFHEFVRWCTQDSGCDEAGGVTVITALWRNHLKAQAGDVVNHLKWLEYEEESTEYGTWFVFRNGAELAADFLTYLEVSE
jgi:hypothetical protein